MPSLLDLRRRIRAVKSTQQITKAMKMISASKLRRAQERVVGARPFALQMQRVLNSVASRVDPATHPLLAEREPGPDSKVLLIVITADKGLCGGFNTNIIKAASAFIASDLKAASAREIESGAIRRRSTSSSGWWAAKGAIFSSAADSRCASRKSGFSRKCVTPTRSGLRTRRSKSSPAGASSKVFIVYNEFKSVMQQRVATEQLLPIPKARAWRRSERDAVAGRRRRGTGRRRRGTSARAG